MAMIQRFELTQSYDHPIHCPFCGKKVIDYEAAEKGRSEDMLRLCDHTLFVATDEGFEYRSPRLDTNLGIEGEASDDPALPDCGFDELTDRVTVPDSIKIVTYAPPPGGLGSYIGFAPTAP